MANQIQAVLTNVGRAALAQSFGGVSGGFQYSYGLLFQIGTGAWVSQGGQEVPVAPDPALTQLQAETSGIFYYQKTFIGGDILFISPSTIQFRCFLDLAFANGDPSIEPDTGPNADGPKNSSGLGGNPPIFFELGIFDPQGVMVAYGTFPGETKLPTKTLNHLVSIIF
jgi:hypothetical protein